MSARSGIHAGSRGPCGDLCAPGVWPRLCVEEQETTMIQADNDEQQEKGEPWGRRLWLAVVLVAVTAACLQSYGIGTWPMADDEVPSLVEMGLINVDPQAFSVPTDQIGRLPKAVPVWYKFQRFAIDWLPNNEISFRLPSVIFGVMTSVLAFVAAARWRGLWFAVALAIVMNASQPFVYLSQLDRFYSLPLLLMTAALVLIWVPRRGAAVLPLIAVLSSLAVLSHNITVAVFGLAFVASSVLWLLGRARLQLAVRSGVAVSVGAVIYIFYLRPLVRGWSSTGNPTPVLVSLAAHLGVPTLALALLGVALCIVRRGSPAVMLWWTLIWCGSLCLLQFTSMSWNPRYFLFFLPAAWVLGGYAVDVVARGLEPRVAAAAWYGCVGLLLMPNLVSHYVDGSRHDYRTAASVIMRSGGTSAPVILSDDAETISYYLPEDVRRNLFVRTKTKQYPPSEFFLVARSNAWTPLPKIHGRQVELLAEIYRRRFDEFSHILRVYRIAPGPAIASGY